MNGPLEMTRTFQKDLAGLGFARRERFEIR